MKIVLCAVLLSLWSFSSPATVAAADGDLDASFGTGGVVDVPQAGGSLSTRLALQPDGKIVLAEIDVGGLELLRYDTSGVLDPTFGVGGVVTQPAPGDSVRGLVRLPDGRLLMLVTRSPTYVLARYDASGNPDPSFGTGGVAALADCGTEFDPFVDFAVRPDGTSVAVIASYDAMADMYAACVVSVDANGALDAGFGAGGVVTLPNWYGASVEFDDDDVLVGGGATVTPFPPGVTRLSSSGGVVNGFGTDGVASVHLSAAGPVADLVVQADGSILVLTTNFQLVRLYANGKVDTSFGAGGVAGVTPEDGIIVDAPEMAAQDDGKIVVSVVFTEFDPPSPPSWVRLFRFDADGTLDASFGTGGVAMSIGSKVSDLVLQPDGKPLIAGGERPSIFFPMGSVALVRHDFTLGCPPSAALGCRGTVAAGGGTLRMDAATNPKPKLQWTWRKGAATTVGDFGDPIGGDDYMLCLYDESSASTFKRGAVIPGGGTCKGKTCWKALGSSGFAYKDSKGTRYGITALKLKAGVDGKAQLQIKGEGSTLPVPTLPAAVPLRVQLLAENGQCWESVFSPTGTTRNDPGRYQGKSD